MHELALAESVVEIAVRHAGARRVEAVNLQIGRLRQVVPSALEFAFELLAAGTVAEGAELRIEEIPVRVRCRACTAENETDEFPLRCSSCGSLDVDVVGGEELQVESLELEDEPTVAGRRR
jgi:hydrogenase nickel incorporation protein HypA/HybF